MAKGKEASNFADRYQAVALRSTLGQACTSHKYLTGRRGDRKKSRTARKKISIPISGI